MCRSKTWTNLTQMYLVYKPLVPCSKRNFFSKDHFQAIFYKSISFLDDQNHVVHFWQKYGFKIYGSSPNLCDFFVLQSNVSIIHLLPGFHLTLNSTREAFPFISSEGMSIFGNLQISIVRWNPTMIRSFWFSIWVFGLAWRRALRKS